MKLKFEVWSSKLILPLQIQIVSTNRVETWDTKLASPPSNWKSDSVIYNISEWVSPLKGGDASYVSHLLRRFFQPIRELSKTNGKYKQI